MLNSIKSELQRMRCTKHHKPPKVKIVGGSLNVDCCCEEFKAIINSKMQLLVGKAASDSINKELKRFFK